MAGALSRWPVIALVALLSGCGTELIPLGSSVESAVPPPAACVETTLGDGTSCKDTSAWKLAASQACTAKGQTLISLEPVKPCPGSDSWGAAILTCCS